MTSNAARATLHYMEITAYLKTSCGWSNGVRAILAKYGLPYEEKDILKNPEFRAEMEQRSGQRLSPCLVVDGQMLPDIRRKLLKNSPSWGDKNFV